MKTPEEIQKAHDMLIGAMETNKEFGLNIIREQDKGHVHSAIDVLCWVLEHDHNREFEENMNVLNKEFETAGYKLESHAQ